MRTVRSFFMDEIRPDRSEDCQYKSCEGSIVHSIRRDVAAGDLISKIFDEGRGQVGFTQLRLYIPLPVGNRTIAHAIPYAQDEPGSSGKPDGDQVYFPRCPRYPSEKIKPDQGQVNEGEEVVEQPEHTASYYWLELEARKAWLFPCQPVN